MSGNDPARGVLGRPMKRKRLKWSGHQATESTQGRATMFRLSVDGRIVHAELEDSPENECLGTFDFALLAEFVDGVRAKGLTS